MAVQEAVGIVSVLGVLLVAYYFVLGRRLGIGHVLDDRGHRVSSADFGGTAAVFLEGLIVVLAISELAAAGGNRGGSFTAGVVIGGVAVAAIILRQWWPGRLGVELFYSVLGLAAAVPAITRLFESTGCAVGVDPAMRIVSVLLMAAIWAGSLVAALVFKVMSGFRTTASGLALFGALDVVLFMSGPVGAGLVGPGGAVWILLGVAVIGGLSGLATNLVMMTCGAFLAVVQLVPLPSAYVADCAGLVPEAPTVMLAGYTVVFWLGAWLISKRRLGRSAVFRRGG